MNELKRQTELLGERVRTLCKIPLVHEQGTSGKAEENLIVEDAFTLEVHYKVRKKKMAMSALLGGDDGQTGEVGGWGRVPFSRNLMSPTPRRKWYLTTGRRAH